MTADSGSPSECSVQPAGWAVPARVARYTPMSVPTYTLVGLLGSMVTVEAGTSTVARRPVANQVVPSKYQQWSTPTPPTVAYRVLPPAEAIEVIGFAPPTPAIGGSAGARLHAPAAKVNRNTAVAVAAKSSAALGNASPTTRAPSESWPRIPPARA